MAARDAIIVRLQGELRFVYEEKSRFVDDCTEFIRTRSKSELASSNSRKAQKDLKRFVDGLSLSASSVEQLASYQVPPQSRWYTKLKISLRDDTIKHLQRAIELVFHECGDVAEMAAALLAT